MNKTLLLVFFFGCGLMAAAQSMNAQHRKVVNAFIQCIKTGNKKALAGKVAYPLKREKPVPSIKNQNEFLKRYRDVFDDSLVTLISRSTPDKDWTVMGWRGIMFKNGMVWLDEDGRLISVNYQSFTESKQKAALLLAEKSKLHESIRVFAEPVCVLETKKYRIRIDDLGNNNYRYASWPLQAEMSSKPDIIIANGKFEADGSGGNHSITFTNNGYRYEIYFTEIGEEAEPPVRVTITKGDKTLLSQTARDVTPD